MFKSECVNRKVSNEMAPRLGNIPTSDLVLFGAIILGIISKDIWDNINLTGEVTIAFPRIIAALIVSPMVYLGVSHYFGEHRQISIVTLAIAFQSGFFWQAIFATAQGRI